MKSIVFLVALLVVPLAAACQTEQKQESKPEQKPASASTAAGSRLAIISIRDVLTQCEQGAQTVSEIQKKFAERRVQLSLLEQEIRVLQDEVKGATVKGPKSALLQDKLQKYGEEEQKLRKEVNQEESQRFAPIIQSVNAAITTYAKEKGISAIQERGGFVYFENGMDITEDIIKRVNQAKTIQQ